MLCHGAPAHSELQEKTFDMDESFTATKDCVYCTSALDLSACIADCSSARSKGDIHS